MFPMFRIRSLVAPTMLLLGSSSVFCSDGYPSIGYGVKSQGMGGVGIALPQDALSLATNPAGPAFLHDRADVGVTWITSTSSVEIVNSPLAGVSGVYDANRNPASPIPEFGVLKKINPAITLGVAVYGSTLGARYDKDQNGRNVPYIGLVAAQGVGMKLDQLFVSPSVAYQLDEKNGVGLALSFVRQRFSTDGLRTLYSSIPESPSTVALSNSETETSTGLGVRLGWTGQVTPNLMLGATWASKINGGKFNDTSGRLSGDGGFDIPETFGLGLSYRFTPRWIFSADVSQTKYGSVNRGVISNATYSFNTTEPLSWPNVPGSGWNDVTVVKLGVSYEYGPTLTLRAGYQNSGQAIPADRVFFNILAPATVRDYLSVGGTWKMPQGGELSAALVHGIKNTVNGVNSQPAFFGRSGGEANISTTGNSLAIAYGWNF